MNTDTIISAQEAIAIASRKKFDSLEMIFGWIKIKADVGSRYTYARIAPEDVETLKNLGYTVSNNAEGWDPSHKIEW